MSGVMYRFMQPGKNCAQYVRFSASVLARGFNDRSARKQPATAELHISFLQSSPVAFVLGAPGTPVVC